MEQLYVLKSNRTNGYYGLYNTNVSKTRACRYEQSKINEMDINLDLWTIEECTPMIDVQLRHDAKKPSEDIKMINDSWKAYIEDMKKNFSILPVKGNFTAIVRQDDILIEGFSGKLLIKSLYSNKKMYSLTTPITCNDFKVYGVYCKKDFSYFITKPTIGFHYVALVNHGREVCTGAVSYRAKDMNILSMLKKTCADIVKSFELINCDSIGSNILPEEYDDFYQIFNDYEDDDRTDKLLDKGLIKLVL